MSLSLEIIQHGSWFLHSYISMSVCRPALTEACMRGNFDTIRATGNWVIAKSVGCLSIRAAGCYWVKAQSFGCLSVSAQQVVTGTSTGSKCNRLDDSLPEEPKSQSTSRPQQQVAVPGPRLGQSQMLLPTSKSCFQISSAS
jgi:hypothetical protein